MPHKTIEQIKQEAVERIGEYLELAYKLLSDTKNSRLLERVIEVAKMIQLEVHHMDIPEINAQQLFLNEKK